MSRCIIKNVEETNDKITNTEQDFAGTPYQNKSSNPIFLYIIIAILFVVVGFLGYKTITLEKDLLMVKNNNTTSTQLEVVPTKTIDPLADWKTYTNKEFGFSLMYPSTWEDITDAGTLKNGNRDFRLQTNKGEFVNGSVLDNPSGLFAEQSWSKQINIGNNMLLLITYTDNIGPGTKGGVTDIKIFNQIVSSVKAIENEMGVGYPLQDIVEIINQKLKTNYVATISADKQKTSVDLTPSYIGKDTILIIRNAIKEVGLYYIPDLSGENGPGWVESYGRVADTCELKSDGTTLTLTCGN